MKDKIVDSISNFGDALQELNEFLDIPVTNKRDRAGVIKAFEFTFELAWKTLKKIAKEDGLETGGPKSTLKAAFSLDLIDNEDESAYLNMLDDRNLMSHVYREAMSLEVFNRIETSYKDILNKLQKRLKERYE